MNTPLPTNAIQNYIYQKVISLCLSKLCYAYYCIRIGIKTCAYPLLQHPIALAHDPSCAGLLRNIPCHSSYRACDPYAPCVDPSFLALLWVLSLAYFDYFLFHLLQLVLHLLFGHWFLLLFSSKCNGTAQCYESNYE